VIIRFTWWIVRRVKELWVASSSGKVTVYIYEEPFSTEAVFGTFSSLAVELLCKNGLGGVSVALAKTPTNNYLCGKRFLCH
jgi:hypothetical protein